MSSTVINTLITLDQISGDHGRFDRLRDHMPGGLGTSDLLRDRMSGGLGWFDLLRDHSPDAFDHTITFAIGSSGASSEIAVSR
ncbi:MAG: hypothetical protein KDJ97_14495 [Anaerolineae bacterium]|nr:hypothetical protein [Anaerolineae bacterium]